MKILVNCSDSLLGKFVGGRLAVDGHSVEIVKNDTDMSAMLERDSFDLVVLVLGHRFAESDTLLEFASKGVRFFVLSNLQDQYSIFSAYKAGAVSYMSLPLDSSRFLLKVRELA